MNDLWDKPYSTHLSETDPLFAYVTKPQKTFANRIRGWLGMAQKDEVVAVLDLRNPDAKWEQVGIVWDAAGNFRID